MWDQTRCMAHAADGKFKTVQCDFSNDAVPSWLTESAGAVSSPHICWQSACPETMVMAMRLTFGASSLVLRAATPPGCVALSCP